MVSQLELSPERLSVVRAKSKDANIVLVGFMGAGKSAVGVRLARRLGRFFVDADQVIAVRAGRTIPEIFREEGEAGFRRRESEIIRQLAGLRRSVIATGGGAIMNEENWRLLQETGIVIWLKAPLDVLLSRVGGDRNRPLLHRGRDELTALYERREPLYARAHGAVDTACGTPDDVVARIVQGLQDAGWLEAEGGAAGSAVSSDGSSAVASGEEGEPVAADGAAALRVELGERSYPIWIGDGLLVRLGELARQAGLGSRVLVVTNPTLERLYGEAALTSLQHAGFTARLCTIPDGERYKTLDTVRLIYDEALAAGLERNSAIVALGGGVLGDTAGFAAATYLRGIDFVQVPTTLLAQVDASVGGKVGVNLPQGKNLIGAFHQPRAVIADTNVLVTLPDRELRAGLAEVVKHGWIADEGILSRLEERAEAVLDRHRDELAYCVRRSCEIKAAIVQADEREEGVRAWLNFGHTFAHGLEAAGGYETMLHGEAVSVGMVAALHLSHRMGWLSANDVARGERLLDRLGLPLRAPGLDPDRVWEAMGHDKKARSGRLRFVLLRGVGRPEVTADVPEQEVRALLEMVCEG